MVPETPRVGSRGALALLRAQGTNHTLKRMRMFKKLTALLATALLAVATFAGEFPDVSVKEVKALTESKKAVIIDVNGS